MSQCVMCEVGTYYGLKHDNGNLICLKCVDSIKQAHVKVYYPTLETTGA